LVTCTNLMIRFKDISIPKPCSVDYDALPGNDIKRFCGNCEKHVYDFRGKDEAYLNEVFRSTGKVCGVYYEDQIQRASLKKQRPFYYVIATKVISIALFLKTLFASYNTHATQTLTHPISLTSSDSTSVEVKFKNHPYLPANYKVRIFINNKIYKSDISPDKGFLYLPDTIQPNDEIKVIVLKTKSNVLNRNKLTTYKVRQKTYTFLYKETPDISIKINNRKQFKIFKRKSNTGVAVGYW
jgi:hypothetical protein